MRSRKPSYVVRPPTAVLTRGFDPRLSVGSARPAVFRSSTYVFSSPESAERAFAIALGKTSEHHIERGRHDEICRVAGEEPGTHVQHVQSGRQDDNSP